MKRVILFLFIFLIGCAIGEDEMAFNKKSWKASAFDRRIEETRKDDGVTWGEGSTLAMKTIEIGDWNMDTTPSVSIPHGLGILRRNVRMISVMIRRDANDVWYLFNGTLSVLAAENISQFIAIDSIQVVIARDTDGFFDSANFIATSFNRGWITLFYES